MFKSERPIMEPIINNPDYKALYFLAKGFIAAGDPDVFKRYCELEKQSDPAHSWLVQSGCEIIRG